MATATAMLHVWMVSGDELAAIDKSELSTVQALKMLCKIYMYTKQRQPGLGGSFSKEFA